MSDEIVYKDFFWGVEYDWMSLDEDGHIGFFSTAGFGFVPQAYVNNLALFEYNYYEEILSMNPLCLAIQVNDFSSVMGIESVPLEHVITATRGIYAFDWHYKKKKYELIAKPEIPRKTESLDETMKLFVEKVKLNCNFEKGYGMDRLIDSNRSGLTKWIHDKSSKLARKVE